MIAKIVIEYLHEGYNYLAEIYDGGSGWVWEVSDGHSGEKLGRGKAPTDLKAMNDAGSFVEGLKGE